MSAPVLCLRRRRGCLLLLTVEKITKALGKIRTNGNGSFTQCDGADGETGGEVIRSGSQLIWNTTVELNAGSNTVNVELYNDRTGTKPDDEGLPVNVPVICNIASDDGVDEEPVVSMPADLPVTAIGGLAVMSGHRRDEVEEV